MSTFSNITILGGGLLGGSMALALRDVAHVRVWSRRQQAVDEAIAIGLHATCSMHDAVSNADLLILAVPVGAMLPTMRQAIEAGLPPTALITDVGSVKRLPHQHLKCLVDEYGLRFIGSHPMAGGEKAGVAHAKATLFQNAACLLTNDDHVEQSLCQKLEEFWQSLGCRTAWMSAAAHDDLVARISHFPHVVAAIGATIALQQPDLGQYGGGGLRDTTRVAGGNPAMWAEILTENHDAILPLLQDASAEIAQLTSLLESKDSAGLFDWLQRAKILRDTLR